MNTIYWCEFPETVNWKELQKILDKLNYNIKIYIPCKTIAQYIWWKKELKKSTPNLREVNVWPILEKNEGYWFSGFTSKENINKLDQFNGTKMKIDLEMPPINYDYSFYLMIKYILRYLFKKAPNQKHLIKKILKLKKESNILINEFPLPKFLLKRWGCYFPKINGINKNIMSYPTIFPRFYIFNYIRKEFKKNKNISVSLGLIGTGILQKEPIYKNINKFKKDLTTIKKIGIKNIAIYSLDSILKRKNPENWLKLIQGF
jgi:hypothetical protein